MTRLPYQAREGLGVLAPPGWPAYHSAALEGTRTATVEVWSGPIGGGAEWVFDAQAGAEIRNHGSLLLSLAARVQRYLSEQEQTAGEQDITSRRYLVALPHGVTVALGNRIKVIGSGDATLDGRYLSILDIMGGSMRIERHLICLDNMG